MKLARLSPRGSKFFELEPSELKRGLLIVGLPGMGQEELLLSLLGQELQSAQGLALLDLSGAFLPGLLEYMRRDQINDTAYLDFADQDYPLRFNLLERVVPEERARVKEGLVVAFKALFGDSWGPRLEYILSYALMAALEYKGGTLLSVQELLVDPGYRRRVLSEVQDPFVQYFFAAEFSQWPERYRREAVAPILNKLGQFFLDPLLRNLICHKQNRIPALSPGQFLLARLPQRELGETACRLLGTTLLVKWLHKAPVPLYLPELHRLSSPGLASLLVQAQENQVGLIISVPGLALLEKPLSQALLNLGLLLAFRTGPDDARLLSQQFDEYRPDRGFQNLIELKPGQFILHAAGRSEQGYLPPRPHPSNPSPKDQILQQSRERFAIKRQVLEDKLQGHLRQAFVRQWPHDRMKPQPHQG